MLAVSFFNLKSLVCLKGEYQNGIVNRIHSLKI